MYEIHSDLLEIENTFYLVRTRTFSEIHHLTKHLYYRLVAYATPTTFGYTSLHLATLVAPAYTTLL